MKTIRTLIIWAILALMTNSLYAQDYTYRVISKNGYRYEGAAADAGLGDAALRCDDRRRTQIPAVRYYRYGADPAQASGFHVRGQLL